MTKKVLRVSSKARVRDSRSSVRPATLWHIRSVAVYSSLLGRPVDSFSFIYEFFLKVQPQKPVNSFSGDANPSRPTRQTKVLSSASLQAAARTTTATLGEPRENSHAHDWRADQEGAHSVSVHAEQKKMRESIATNSFAVK